MASDLRSWQARFDDLAREHRVTGASLAVLHDGEISAVATGTLNVETGVEATPDSLFQIGSITKLYTAVLAMQLVESGALGLDDPIVSVLPELRLADPDTLRQVTLRHLLSHSSGIEGDHFVDVGRGDDAVERYVATCADLGFSHPVGATMSYCNTGYIIAGRIVEVLTERIWDVALKERLREPLGLTHTVTLPEDAMRFRVAHGHVVEPDQEPRLVSTWTLPRSTGPAGLILATAADTVAFARLHLDGGVASDGTRILAQDTVAAMREPQIEIPDHWTLGTHWGLGWILFDWDGRRVFGHDGGTMGQVAYLRAVPDAGVAVALLTNGGNAQDLYEDVFRELLAELCGLAMPRPLEAPAEPPRVDVSELAGRYERVGVRFELESDGNGSLRGHMAYTGYLAEIDDDPEEEFSLVPVDDRLFVTRFGDERSWTPMVFFELADGSPYMHMGVRATPKVR
jgi:CubicO group peptidase (beta-lactamase class C family)